MHLQRKTLIIIILMMVIGTMALAQSFTFKVDPAALKPGEKGNVRVTMTMPADKHQSHDPAAPDYFYLEASHPSLSFGKTVYPKAHKVVSPNQWDYHGSVTLTLPFSVKSDAKPGKISFKTLLAYNLCFDNGMCEPPEEEERSLTLDILAVDTAAGTEAAVSDPANPADAEVQPISTEAGTSEIDAPAAAPEARTPVAPATYPLSEILKYMLFALLGGLILNITPCVLPILPIRVMSIINQAHQDRAKVMLHTWVYTLGVLVSFAILGGVFVGLRSAGEQQGWGFQNQNPMFTVVLMSVVFVFALSLLGVFVLTAPGMGTASRATAKKGYSGSFFGGIFAFLMAISCTGPFLGAALPFAFKLSSPLLILFFLVLGLGFALPFIMIGFFPGALKLIPKPGEWMNIFKEVMGFVLLYIVFTMLKTTLALTGGDYLLNVIFFMLLLGFGVWLYGRFVRMENSRATQWIFTVVSLAIIVYAAYTFLPIKPEHLGSAPAAVAADGLTPAPHAPEGWYVFSPELFDKLQAEGKPVFLDIGAAWCKNCLTNEKTVLFTEKIMAEFAAKGVVLLRGDFTRKDAVLLAWIQKHDRAGVPFNALYIPGKEPILFPELISAGHVRDALAQIP